MITVLADDITGAAEIAGVCLRFGLSVRFDFDYQIEQVPSADVWIIVSDTRSLPESEACETVRSIARFLQENRVNIVFKKIDSALRGHIIPEIKALLEFVPKREAFILPANPESGRVIKEGVYYVGELPLAETSFAFDPDFPAKTSLVKEIVKMDEADQAAGFIIPDIVCTGDYRNYARQTDTDALPVGGSAFFEAYLQVCFPWAKQEDKEKKRSITLGNNILMICGSTQETSRRFIRENGLFTMIEIPCQEIDPLIDPVNLRHWTVHTVNIFNRCKRILITVENGGQQQLASPAKVKTLLAAITKRLLADYPVEELFIEGGATAYACLSAAGISSLIPVEEFARGVVRLQVPGRENLYLTIKPGSYEWPEKLFRS